MDWANQRRGIEVIECSVTPHVLINHSVGGRLVGLGDSQYSIPYKNLFGII